MSENYRVYARVVRNGSLLSGNIPPCDLSTAEKASERPPTRLSVHRRYSIRSLLFMVRVEDAFMEFRLRA